MAIVEKREKTKIDKLIQNQEKELTQITFSKLNHFWLDSGLVGLTVILREVNKDIELLITDQGLTIVGNEDEITNAINQAYDYLIKEYYNKSTKKQLDDLNNYQFYYDRNKDCFVKFPKKSPFGIIKFYNAKPREKSGLKIKWVKGKKYDKEIIVDGRKKKVKRSLLPEEHAYLQKRLDEFLDKNSLDIMPSGMLVDQEYEIRPRVSVSVGSADIKGTCYICGGDSHCIDDASQTTLPFITGESGVLSFNSLTGKPEKVCWKCSLLGKFVPVNGFYTQDKDSLFIFFPFSSSFEKMVSSYKIFQDKYEDPNLFRNFDYSLGGYFRKPFEVTFAFLYTIYEKIFLSQKGEKKIDFWQQLTDIAASKAPLEFIVVHVKDKSNTFMGKMVWHFRDTVYFFRLIEYLENNIQMAKLMHFLVDFSQKKEENKTLIRNKICERMLKKQSVLDLIEKYVYSSGQTYLKPLLDFIVKYEPIIREEGNGMLIEEQEVAVSLGKSIGMVIGKSKDRRKGDLFALRRARKKTDFLNQLNRLQFRYNLMVPPGTFEGALNDINYLDFKHFCLIAALNSFYYVTKPERGE